MLSEKIYTTLKNPVITEKAAIEKSTSNTLEFFSTSVTEVCFSKVIFQIAS